VSAPRLLLLASKMGYQTRSFAEAAKRVGVDVTIGSDRCHQLSDPWSDGAIALRFDQPETAAQELANGIRGAAASGILALGDRQAATAAHAARLLGLRYNSPVSVENCRSKLRQRQILHAAGLPVPEFFDFHVTEAVATVLARAVFPCVLKPLCLSASQGVIFKLLASAEVQVTRERDLNRILVERYIPGGEVALEGLLVGGTLRVLTIFDKPDLLEGPYFEETIYTTPSRRSAAGGTAGAARRRLARRRFGKGSASGGRDDDSRAVQRRAGGSVGRAGSRGGAGRRRNSHHSAAVRFHRSMA
jgi:biotin carboxylase